VCKGLLIEEARTNSLTNNTMVGTVAGSPGTAPTGWFPTSTGGVFTRTIVGVGVENGIAYIDIRYQASGSGNASVQPIGGTTVAASNGQTWTYSSYVKLVGGTLTNVTVNDTLGENSAAGAFLAAGDSANYVPTTASLISQRRAYTRTNTNASTAYVYSRTRIAFSGAGDVTLRFGLPQLELGAFATSVVQTSTAAVTRNADVVTMTGTNFSSWFNASEGAFNLWANVYEDASRTMLELSKTGSGYAELFVMAREASLDRWQTEAVAGGATQSVLNPSPNTFTINANHKCSFAYKSASYAAAADGTTVATSTGSVPTGLDRLSIGHDLVGGGNFMNGYVQKLLYWPQRLINAEVQAFSK
jgi:hypothetical protein